MNRGLRRGNWSVQELERLRQLLPRRGVAATAALLRRSADSVQRKALELLRVPPRRGDWTESDDAVVREAWGAVDIRMLAAMTGRSAGEVRRRGIELQARQRSGPWQRDEQQRLKDLYGTRRDADLAVCLQRAEADIVAMAAAMCLAKDKRFAAREAWRKVPAPVAATPERMRMPRWTAAEVERLRELYADRDNLTVARMLGRSVTGVANKANQLGLKKSQAVLAAIGRVNVAVRYTSTDGEAAAGT